MLTIDPPVQGGDSRLSEPPYRRLNWRWWIPVAMFLIVSGCSAMVSSATNRLAGNLADAIADHDDPATVEAALPAYLVMMDAMVRGNPKDPNLLTKAASLYSAYAGVFVEDRDRSRTLTAKSMAYAMSAVCLTHPSHCSLRQISFEQFKDIIAGLSAGDVPTYFTLGASWAGWIQAHQDDLDAVAELPRVEILMRRVLELDEGYMQGSAHLYLGVMSILLPPALGGKPDVARDHFERAIELSNGDNLMVKVMYARHYARMLFDRQLHDRLLQEVLSSDPDQQGYVLVNTLARRQARQLLETAQEYF